MAGLRKKDTGSLDYLYSHYSSALYGAIFRIVGSDDVAEEVLQDAFLRIWEKIGSYDETKGRLFTWMLNVSRNLAIDKTRSKEITKSKKTGDIDLFVNRIDRSEHSQSSVDTIGLKEVMSQLKDEQRFVVEYLYLRGYTQSELAEEFNIPLGTVKTRLRLAMVELRTILKVS